MYLYCASWSLFSFEKHKSKQWRSKETEKQGKEEKQKSREAEQWRSRETKKHKGLKAEVEKAESGKTKSRITKKQGNKNQKDA